MMAYLQLEILLLGQDVSSISSSKFAGRKINFFFIFNPERSLLYIMYLTVVNAQIFVGMPLSYLLTSLSLSSFLFVIVVVILFLFFVIVFIY